MEVQEDFRDLPELFNKHKVDYICEKHHESPKCIWLWICRPYNLGF
jgi:hypothetical protein